MTYGVVYVIRNTVNRRVYVGATKGDPRKRLWQFRSVAGHPGKWPRIENMVVQDMRRIGPREFGVEVLERCENAEAMEAAERDWILRLNSLVPGGYNIEGGGLVGRDRGCVGLATGAAHRGRKRPESWKQNISAAMLRRSAANHA